MKLHEKITEVFETDLGLELNEEELIATQETLRKIGDAAHELDKKTNEIGNYYYAECYLSVVGISLTFGKTPH